MKVQFFPYRPDSANVGSIPTIPANKNIVKDNNRDYRLLLCGI